MTPADVQQVVAIERESFPTSWPQTAYRRELANHLARYVVLIDRTRKADTPAPTPRWSLLRLWRRQEEPALTTDHIVGYVGLWLMVDDAHIVAIAVREAYRGQGLGELLLAEAIEIAMATRVENVTLEVRRSNSVAQALYEKYQFLKVGVRPRYYSDNHEDAIIMSTPPIRSSPYRERVAGLREAYAARWGSRESDAG